MIKKSLVAIVNERSSHAMPTPHGGGIALAMGWFMGLGYLYLVGEIEPNLFYALLFGGNYFLVLAATVLGFLYWNWNKAKIFMGDVGSTLLGYNVALFTIYYANQDASNFWIWIILFGVYWFDATLTLTCRKLKGEKLN